MPVVLEGPVDRNGKRELHVGSRRGGGILSREGIGNSDARVRIGKVDNSCVVEQRTEGRCIHHAVRLMVARRRVVDARTAAQNSIFAQLIRKSKPRGKVERV